MLLLPCSHGLLWLPPYVTQDYFSMVTLVMVNCIPLIIEKMLHRFAYSPNLMKRFSQLKIPFTGVKFSKDHQ